MKSYDYLIVGAGLFGSVFAREMTDRGKKCLVIDRRNHIGGNVYTENVEGINVHKYGPHIFHTNDERIWQYVNRHAEFNSYRHRVRVVHGGTEYSFPINLKTLQQLWGVDSSEEARALLDIKKVAIGNPSNLEDWILSQVGEELYEIFVKGYTIKQWGREPRDLPSSIIRRIPIRTEANEDYFDDRFQGIPKGGYTGLVANLLKGIEVRLNCDFFQDRVGLTDLAGKVVYTGPLDSFFNCDLGNLEYRSLRFENEKLDLKQFQSLAQINYSEPDIPFTRIIEHKHFEFGTQSHTVITREYPTEWSKGAEPYYPINDSKNKKLADEYQRRAEKLREQILFGGRLAEYRYYDMHQVVGAALNAVERAIQTEG